MAENPAPPPPDPLAVQIWDAATLYDAGLTEALQPYGVTPVEYRVLTICLHHEGATATTIASTAPLDPSSISRIVHRLVQRGLVARRRSQADRRVVFLRLTDAGHELMTDVEAAVKAYPTTVTGWMSDAEAQFVTAAVSRVIATLHPARSLLPKG